MNQKGQGLIEFVTIIPFVMVCLSALFILSYSFSCKIYLDRITEEITVCSQYDSAINCERKAEANIKSTLPFGRLDLIKTKTKPSSVSSEIVFNVLNHINISSKFELGKTLIQGFD